MGSPGKNPYVWDRHKPDADIAVLRTETIEDVKGRLVKGEACVLYGGRGMGKSALLYEIEKGLKVIDGVHVVRVINPPDEDTTSSAFQQIASFLELTGIPAHADPRWLVDEYRKEHAENVALVLLYDDMDSWASRRGAGALGKFFNNLESARRERDGFGILAAGGIGAFLPKIRDSIGSDFLSRASPHVLRPFSEGEIKLLARAFDARGTPLSAGVITAVSLISGGNVALATYGLQKLWDVNAPTEQDVAAAYARFQTEGHQFIKDCQRCATDPGFTKAPSRVLEVIRESKGVVPRDALRDACETIGDEQLYLDPEDVLMLLESSALVRVDGSRADDPVHATEVASVLSLPPRKARPRSLSLQGQLTHDLQRLLRRIHAMAVDFFRAEGQLVPEAVFSAFLAMGMGCLGWEVEREAMSAAGRTDLKLRRPGVDGLSVVEVKIWGRKGAGVNYRNIHQQIEGYWTDQVRAAAGVMIAASNVKDWCAKYKSRCLSAPAVTTEQSDIGPPFKGQWNARSKSGNGFDVAVEHLLLWLPRRARERP